MDWSNYSFSLGFILGFLLAFLFWLAVYFDVRRPRQESNLQTERLTRKPLCSSVELRGHKRTKA